MKGMNLYFCTDGLHDSGLYVAAGVYDENCEALEAAGVRYCEED